MEQVPTPSINKSTRVPWNKGKLVGPKPPLRPSHVWSIRTKLQMGDRKRDLALFNIAIDSKLRGCDVVALRVEDVAPSGYAMDRALLIVRSSEHPMSSIQSQFLDLTAHHAKYDAIDPRSALKHSARDKVVFITGASRGIGQATAVAFAEADARAVYLTARSEAALQETRALVGKANPATRCAYSVCDVTSAKEMEAVVADCVAQFGGIDVADANAGFLGPWTKIGASDPEGWWHSWEVNVRGAYHVIRYTVAHLAQSAKRRAAEGRSGGHLILLSSIGAQLLMPGASDYQTSKHAINRLCEFVGVDHGDDGIKCFALHPGGVSTELGLSMPQAMHAHLVDNPDLPAAFAVWLCSGHADWAQGRYLSANWDVQELSALKDSILNSDLLVNRLRGKV